MSSTALETNTKPASRPIRVRIPFVSTSFAHNLVYYALLWPVWWLLGIEQILLPFFLIYEMARCLIRAQWQVRVNATILSSLMLAMWWLVPIGWADREFLDIFLKETATIWSQLLMLVLVWNEVRSEEEWWLVVRALIIFAAYTAATGFIYVGGLWRGEVVSLIGRVLPTSLVDSSAFFTSIAYRRFGEMAIEVGLLRHRLSGLSLSFSSLSMICLLLLPLIAWRGLITRGVRRIFYIIVFTGLVIGLVYAESRISYLAFIAGAAIFVVLWLGLLRGHNRVFTIAASLMAAGMAVVLVYATADAILHALQSAFIDLRPGSWLVRFNIYIVSLRLLPEHPIAGWGVPVRIPGASSTYSAGTHSSFLGMLFTHGIIGLLLYLAIWLSIWKTVLAGLRERQQSRDRRVFWVATASALLAFNIREVADSWWWDQSLTFVLWLMWGIALTAIRFGPARQDGAAAERAAAAEARADEWHAT